MAIYKSTEEPATMMVIKTSYELIVATKKHDGKEDLNIYKE